MDSTRSMYITSLLDALNVRNEVDAISIVGRIAPDTGSTHRVGGESMLFKALWSVPVMQAMLEKGWNPKITNSSGKRLLWKCAGDLNTPPGMVTLLAAHGCDVSEKFEDPRGGGYPHISLVTMASRALNAAIVVELVKAGADCSDAAADAYGESALHHASNAMNSSLDPDGERFRMIVETLVAAGMSIDGRAETGRTPLHRAARLPDASQHVAILLAAGANPECRDDDNLTPEDLALAYGKHGHVALLRSHAARKQIAAVADIAMKRTTP